MKLKFLKNKRIYGLVLASVSVLAASPRAGADTAVSLTPDPGQVSTGDWSLGFLFSVNSAINVTQLGFFDDNGDGLASSHDVGIYTTSGSLLVSATVSTSDPLDGLFRYVGISPLSLTAGQQYIIAASTGPDTPTNPGDPFVYNPLAFSTAPEITFIEARFIASPALAFPVDSQASEGYFGPNFKFEAAAAVPEPSAFFSAATAGLVGLGVARRRRRSA